MSTKNINLKSDSGLLTSLTTILQAGTAGTQDEIKKALEKQGHEVNQSKISRALRKMGAIKIMNEQRQIIYALPKEPALPHSKNVLSQLIVSIDANEHLIVISTNPGSASLIARFLDHHRTELNILGTVAGDDALFVAPKSVKQLADTVRLIHSFLGKVS
jgi:transcriptional regulator of arginine metabolism